MSVAADKCLCRSKCGTLDNAHVANQMITILQVCNTDLNSWEGAMNWADVQNEQLNTI